jgi:Phosphotransferase enzyme family
MLERGTERFVLKRTSSTSDWIVRATRDDDIREAWLADLAGRGQGSWFGAPTGPPWDVYLGAAADPDGDGAVILMRDVSTELAAWERPAHSPVLALDATDRLLDRLALLHSMPWSTLLAAQAERSGGPPPPWCPLPERLTLLTPRAAARYERDENPVGAIFLRGWDGFARHAPGAARELIEGLDADPGRLVAALAALPALGLHGDLKLANVALAPDERVRFIDWQMTLEAPAAVELGWSIVTNSAELPVEPDEVLRRYLESLRWYAGRWGAGTRPHDLEGLVGDWDAQVDLAMLVGLLLRGWRKGRDTDDGATLGSGVAAADDLAWWCRRALEAAERRL